MSRSGNSCWYLWAQALLFSYPSTAFWIYLNDVHHNIFVHAAPRVLQSEYLKEFLADYRNGGCYLMALRTTVYQLTQHRQPFWLSVRVIHMWEAFNDPPAMTCLLLDINGDAIQAVFRGTEAVQVRHKLKKMMSYDIYRYTPIAPPPFDKVAPIDIAIQIDRNLIAVPLEDNLELPYKYFNFMARHHLNNWPILNRQLIDYMGKITDLEEAHIEENTTVLRVTLQAPGSRPIVISLWNNIYEDLIIPNITEVDHEVIFLATTLRVVPIPGSVRLQCTAGTRLFVDPGLPEKKDMAAYFRNERNGMSVVRLSLRAVSEVHPVPGYPISPIPHLYQQTPITLLNQTYLLACTIIAMPEQQPWYYVTCDACQAIVNDNIEPHACMQHGGNYLNYCYRISCVVTDHAGTIRLNLSDNNIVAMTGILCYNMISINGFAQNDVVPPPVLQLIGSRWIFAVTRGHAWSDTMLQFEANTVSQVPPPQLPPLNQAPVDPGTSEDRFETELNAGNNIEFAG